MNNDPTTKRRLKRLTKVLHSHSLYTRQDVLDTFDTRADFSALDGIGPVLSKTLSALLQECEDEECWARETGMSS